MKRIFAVLGFLAILLLACNLPGAGTQVVIIKPIETSTPTKKGPIAALKTKTESVLETPTSTEIPTSETNAACNELSFYLDPTLATSYHCETVPEFTSPTGFGTNPQYTKVSLGGYVLSDRAAQPVISVYPVDPYRQLLPDLINADVAALQALIASGAPGSSEPPYLPAAPAHELFVAQFAVVPFHNGSGIHFLTMMAQNYYPVNNHDMIFSYQGLTSDGKYWISIILPISHPNLPENGDNPPADLNSNPDAYYAQITSQLNAELPKSFIPSIVKLNALIKSITIQP